MLFQSMDESSSLKDISISPVTWPEKKGSHMDFSRSISQLQGFFHGTFAFFTILALKEVQRSTRVINTGPFSSC